MKRHPAPVENLLDEEHLELLANLNRNEYVIVTKMLQEADALSFPDEPRPPMRLQMVKRILQLSAARDGKRSDQLVEGLKVDEPKTDPDAYIDAPTQPDDDDEPKNTKGGFFHDLRLKD